MKITQDKDKLEITGVRFYGDIYQKVMGCPDRKILKNGRFLCLNSFSNVEYLLQTFPEALWEGEADILKHQYYAQKKQEQLLLDSKDADFGNNDYPDVFKTRPFAHQLQAFEVSKDAEAYGLFFEQGCGKTKVTIDNATYLFTNGKIDAMVIIAPNGVHKNWITDELPTHCNIPYAAFCWEGNLNKKNQELLDTVNKSPDLKIYSFNIECFAGIKQPELLLKIMSANRCLMVVDESQTIKNPSALRTKFISGKAGRLAKYKRILSGTPITKGTEDIYSQFQFLDPKIIGIASFYAFKARYCRMGGYLNKMIIGYNRIDELQEKIKTYTMRVLKKECLDLPEKIYQKEPFSLTADQIRIYQEIRDEGIAYCQNRVEPVTFDNVLSRMMKLQQISSGYIMNVDEKLVEIVAPEHNPRLNKLKDILSNIDGKVIIWTTYTQDIEYIMKILKHEAVRYDGKMDRDQKELSKNNFKNDPNIKYFVANLQAADRGLTLTEATTAIYYNNSYDLELRLQSEDRCHRIGTTQNVLYIDLEAQKTLDKKIIRTLRSKKKIADMVLQDPENLFMEN